MIHKIGNKYNELTYVGDVGYKTYPSGQRAKLWRLKCSCGVECVAPDRQVTSNLKKSCGHLKKHPNIKTHGDARGKSGTPEWRGWRAMKNRCTNPNDVFYSKYGGRGITICNRWLKYENFLEDMGRKPSHKHTLDRINNDGNYEPANCKWSTPIEQANNKRNTKYVTYKGKTDTVANWARELDIGYFQLYDRLRSSKVTGVDDAFSIFI